MELTILGSSGSYPTATSPCSGYLLRHEGFNMWMDAGNGTLGELQKHIGIREVHAVALSHSHPDHCVDLYPFFFALLFPEPEAPVPVFAPPGVRERLDHMIGEDSRDRWHTYLAWQELAPGNSDEAGPFELTAFDAAHSVANNTLRVAAGGKVLCYSGDTGANEHLVAAARDADLFLCESSWTNDQEGFMGPIHLTAGEAGRAARDAGARSLMLTHLWPDNDPEIVRMQAADAFNGPISLAAETGTVTL